MGARGSEAGECTESVWIAAEAISPIFVSGNFISPTSKAARAARLSTAAPNVGRDNAGGGAGECSNVS